MTTQTKRFHRNTRPRRAFTLVELLTVIGIIAVLAALLFPVFAQVRAKSRETVCVSNLRQIGTATLMYAGDYDDLFPWAGDPLDFRPGAWAASPYAAQVATMQPLPDILSPYTKSKQIWHCPADTGFAVGGRSEATPFETRPSSFDLTGTSYYYYTSLPLQGTPVSAMRAWGAAPPYEERGPSQVVFLYDGTGLWHGGYVMDNRRYGGVYADGHARVLGRGDFAATFAHVWTKPN